MQVKRKSTNGEFEISPLRIESKLRFEVPNTSDEEISPLESPGFKKQYSMASTIDSPLSVSYLQDEK